MNKAYHELSKEARSLVDHIRAIGGNGYLKNEFTCKECGGITHASDLICPDCYDKKFEVSDESVFLDSQEKVGIPKIFRNVKVETISPTEAQKHALSHVWKMCVENYSGPGIGLYGPTGTGKTHILAGIANDYLRRGESVIWLDGNDLRRKITQSWRDKPEDRPLGYGIENEIASYRLVVIEDFTPGERLPEFLSSGIIALFNAILNEGDTILCISSNFTPDKLSQFVMPEMTNPQQNGFTSRLKSLTEGYVLAGKDLRQHN